MPTCNSERHAGQTIVWADSRKQCIACKTLDALTRAELRPTQKVYPERIMTLFDDLIEAIKKNCKPAKKAVPTQDQSGEQIIANGTT